MAYADLEIGLHRRDVDRYVVELRFSLPNSDADLRLTQGRTATATFDWLRLRSESLDPEAYGRLLGEALFGDELARTAFAQAVSTAGLLNTPLRVRLVIGDSAPELHSLRWETLRHPRSPEHLLANEQVLFSRYIACDDWRPVNLRTQAEQRALAVVASPHDLDRYAPMGQALMPINAGSELRRVRTSLGSIPVETLPDHTPAMPTANQLSIQKRARVLSTAPTAPTSPR